MRIYLAVRHSADPSQFFGDLWSRNFVPALRELGHEVIESTVDLLPASRFMQIGSGFTAEEHGVRGQLTDAIVDEVASQHREQGIDLVLTYFYNAHFAPDGFARIRDLGIPTVNFFCNSMYQFDLVREVAAAADFSWHPERDAASTYRDAGATPVCVQMAADPNVYRPVDVERTRDSAVFVGQRYADRDRWLRALMNADIPFDLYGAGWGVAAPPSRSRDDAPESYLGRRSAPAGTLQSYAGVVRENVRSSGWVSGIARSARQLRYRQESRKLTPRLAQHHRGWSADVASTFSEYPIVLNFSNVWKDGRSGSRLIPHVRLRDFEAPMSRSCYLTGYSSELEEFYEIGREVDTYRTEAELVDKTRFYLRNPPAAERLREAAYRRARADHTWKQRFQTLFAATGLNRSRSVR